MTFTVLRNSCTLYTFTVLRQKALAFTLPPPYDTFVRTDDSGRPFELRGRHVSTKLYLFCERPRAIRAHGTAA